jgi:cytochrome c
MGMSLPRSVRLSVCLLASLAALSASAVQLADAMALLRRAIAHVESVGEKQAFGDFQDKSKKFVEGELYVMGYAMDGTCVTHGADPSLIGKNRLGVADPDGRHYIAELIEEAKTKDTGVIDYKFKNPVSGQVEKKVLFWKRPPGKEWLLGVGVYKR